MSNNLNDIDLLFKQKLTGLGSTTNDFEWSGFERKLVRKRFMRFSAHTFNIYYAILFTGLTAFGSYSTYKYVALNFNKPLQNNIKQKCQPILNSKPCLIPNKTNYTFTDTVNEIESKKVNLNKISSETKSVETKNATIPPPDTAIKKTELPLIPTPDTVVITKNTVIKKVIKKRVIIKQNAVIKHDTIVFNK